MQQEKSAMLLRKSRADMEAEAQGLDTLARHEEWLDELAKNLGIVVREEDRFCEKVSGGDIEDRYEMQRSQSSWKTLNEKRQEEVRSEMELLRQDRTEDVERLIFNNQNVIDALRDSSVSAKNKNVLMKEIIEKIDYTKVDGVLYLDVFYR